MEGLISHQRLSDISRRECFTGAVIEAIHSVEISVSTRGRLRTVVPEPSKQL